MKIKLNNAVSKQVAIIYRISMRLETVDAAAVAIASLTHHSGMDKALMELFISHPIISDIVVVCYIIGEQGSLLLIIISFGPLRQSYKNIDKIIHDERIYK